MLEQWLHYRTNGVSLSLEELLLFKKQHHSFDLAPKGKIQAQLSGGYLARSKGRGTEFDEARHYQAGDDAGLLTGESLHVQVKLTLNCIEKKKNGQFYCR